MPFSAKPAWMSCFADEAGQGTWPTIKKMPANFASIHLVLKKVSTSIKSCHCDTSSSRLLTRDVTSI